MARFTCMTTIHDNRSHHAHGFSVPSAGHDDRSEDDALTAATDFGLDLIEQWLISDLDIRLLSATARYGYQRPAA